MKVTVLLQRSKDLVTKKNNDWEESKAVSSTAGRQKRGPLLEIRDEICRYDMQTY